MEEMGEEGDATRAKGKCYTYAGAGVIYKRRRPLRLYAKNVFGGNVHRGIAKSSIIASTYEAA